jgi:AraC-like DNA-binding protein/quercetin dioxygenase-like cupin family protein
MAQSENWESLSLPTNLGPPHPMIVRAESLPARHFFPEHSHDWNQLVHAISGVLTVTAEGSCFAISPEQAVWLPSGTRHRVGSLLGSEFRSLWIAKDGVAGVAEASTVFRVSPLLRALIIEAAEIQRREEKSNYAGRVTTLILDQLRRAEPLPAALPWPRGGILLKLCDALYADPSDPRRVEEWGTDLGMSARTLARRFEEEVGMSMRTWRRRLRLFKAIELLAGDLSVTEIALELGYGSTSAFTYAFRTEMGRGPQLYRLGASQT